MQNSALLVMDMQSAVLAMMTDTTVIKRNMAKAINNARKKNIPVLYVVVGFRQGAPEINTNNKSFAAFKERTANANPEEWMKIDESITPKSGEIVITKRRVSAFAGSDLEIILRAKGIQHLILAGIATSGVVLSTLREAADKDFRLTVISDCCADRDEEVHKVLLEKVFPRQADVIALDDWAAMPL